MTNIAPNPNTAFLIDAALSYIDTAANAPEAAFAMQEFAMGVPGLVRPIDLCWGFAPLGKRDAATLMSTGTGVVRGDAIYTYLSPPNITDPSLLLGASPVQDAYAFGSVFLALQYNSQNAVPSISLPVALVGPGSPILMARTHDLATVTSWLRGGHVPSTPVPSGAGIELWRFVLDITKYDPAALVNNVIGVSMVDVRRPRGWGGFAEETMAAILVPAAINFRDTSVLDAFSSKEAILQLVQKWASLKGWPPNFIDYWRASATPLPVRLHNYLAQNLGINV